MKYRMLAIVGATSALLGCKVEMATEVKMSDLYSQTIKQGVAEFNVEIPSCGSHRDSRQESDSLVKARARIPEIFPKAQYVECFKKQFNSYASFKLPITLGEVGPNSVPGDDTFHLGIKRANEPQANDVMYIATTPALRSKIANGLKGMPGTVSPSDITIKINIGNDTDGDLPVHMYSVFIGDFPAISNGGVLKKGGGMSLTLSNVSVASILNAGINETLVFSIQKAQ